MLNIRTVILSAVLMLVLVATFAVAPAQIALADAGVGIHTFDVTFTKWITTIPEMVGIVGGDVGAGTFAGEILDLNVVGSMEYVEAIYHVNGGKHSFTAHIYATQDDSAGTGVITGRVSEGWLKGASVTGEYNVFAECPIATPGNGMGTLCFQGTLHLRRDDVRRVGLPR